MGILARLRSIVARTGRGAGVTENTSRLAEASDVLDDLRGDRLSPQPPDHGTSAVDNVAAAAKDYGLSRFSGESDALAGAAKSYRPAKSRKQRKREG
ncbi:MAG: hypothetical protein R8J94_17160 [Acidimicrobiia bacterium]|nr:hypothetical protein [Acidimicrobiia bacterium]